MLSLEKRSDLLVQAAELNSSSLFADVISLLSKVDRPLLDSEPELGFCLAHALYRQERHSEALDLLQRLVEPCRRQRRTRLFRRRLNLEGVIYLNRGRTGDAERAFLEVQQSAIASNDQEYVAYCALNLGTVASIRGEWFKASAALRRAVAAFHTLGRTYGLAACHQNLAITYFELGLLSEAASESERAHELFMEISRDLVLEIASTEIQRSLVVLALGDSRAAEEIVMRAIRSLKSGRLPNSAPRHEGEALRVLGIVLARQGKLDQARVALDRALICARTGSDLLLEAEVCETIANEIRPNEQRSSWLEEAVRIYAALEANARASRAIRRFSLSVEETAQG